jgi:hypothetical protein
LFFATDSLALTVLQAACIALPAAGLPAWAQRFRSNAWALVLPLSIAVVIGAIALAPATANLLTWVALALVPPGCALALAWAGHGARPVFALATPALLGLVWALPGDRLGQAAGALLITGSAVTLGRLLAGVAPLGVLKAGVLAMATLDAILVFSNQLQVPNALLVAASPGLGLPQLQSAAFGGAGLGYGDFFAAAVVGAIVAAQGASPHVRAADRPPPLSAGSARVRAAGGDRSPPLSADDGSADAPTWRVQAPAAVAMIVVSLCWDQLFLIYDVLPATIPPALVLAGLMVRSRWSQGRSAGRRRRSAAGRGAPTPGRAA